MCSLKRFWVILLCLATCAGNLASARLVYACAMTGESNLPDCCCVSKAQEGCGPRLECPGCCSVTLEELQPSSPAITSLTPELAAAFAALSSPAGWSLPPAPSVFQVCSPAHAPPRALDQPLFLLDRAFLL